MAIFTFGIPLFPAGALVTSAHSPPLRGGEYFWSRRRFSLGIPSMPVEKWHSTPFLLKNRQTS